MDCGTRFAFVALSRDEHAGFVDGTQKKVRGGDGVARGNQSVSDGRLEAFNDELQRTPAIEFAPARPAERGGGFGENYAMRGRVAAELVEKRHDGQLKSFPRITLALNACPDAGDEGVVDTGEDGRHEFALVGEVVIQRATSNAGCTDHLFGTYCRVPMLSE